MSRLLIGLALAAGTLPLLAGPTPTDVEFNLLAVEDSGAYFVYRYELVNPRSSSGGLTSVAMDVSARSGTPTPLPATGDFLDFTGSAPPPFAEVGPDAPPGWEAMLTVQAKLRWSLPTLLDSSPDSVSPGDTVRFAIRSSYLPGIRTMFYGPTVESCCLEPVDASEERWAGSPIDYEVEGVAVGPRYQPAEVDVELVIDQLHAACHDLLWIRDLSLCSELSDSLTAAKTRFAIDDAPGAASAVEGARELIETNAGPAGRVNGNAVQLLRLNTTQLLANRGT